MAGTEQCVSGTWLACAGEVTPDPEKPDAKDNDCDGRVDQGFGDLVVHSLTATPATLKAGEKTLVTVCLKNVGKGGTDPFVVRLFFSPDKMLDKGLDRALTGGTGLPADQFPPGVEDRWISSIRADHPLILVESTDGRRTVGIAARGWRNVFHNCHPMLACIHSAPMPAADLKSGETAVFSQRIHHYDGGRCEFLDEYDREAYEFGNGRPRVTRGGEQDDLPTAT